MEGRTNNIYIEYSVANFQRMNYLLKSKAKFALEYLKWSRGVEGWLAGRDSVSGAEQRALICKLVSYP